tara:strand:- start:35564 stop:37210 length:1647 start_codon:yes stop_codon:yes gene_type:complete
MATFKQRKRSKKYTENLIQQIKQKRLDEFFHAYFKHRFDVELFEQFTDSNIYQDNLNELVGIPGKIYVSQFKEIFDYLDYVYNFYDVGDYTYEQKRLEDISHHYHDFIAIVKYLGFKDAINTVYEMHVDDEEMLIEHCNFVFWEPFRMTPFVYPHFEECDDCEQLKISYNRRNIISEFELHKQSKLVLVAEPIIKYKEQLDKQYAKQIDKIDGLNNNESKSLIITQFYSDYHILELFQCQTEDKGRYLVIQDWLHLYFTGMISAFAIHMNMENYYLFKDFDASSGSFLNEIDKIKKKNPYVFIDSFSLRSVIENYKTKKSIIKDAKKLIVKINHIEKFISELFNCENEAQMKNFIFSESLPDIDDVAMEFITSEIVKEKKYLFSTIMLVMELAREAMIEDQNIDFYEKRDSLVKKSLEQMKDLKISFPEYMPTEDTVLDWIKFYEDVVQHDPLIIEFLKNQEIKSSEEQEKETPLPNTDEVEVDLSNYQGGNYWDLVLKYKAEGLTLPKVYERICSEMTKNKLIIRHANFDSFKTSYYSYTRKKKKRK